MLQILHLNPALDYNVHFPIRRGELNIHSGIGGSLTSVLTDLQTIWSWIINYKLDIPLKDLKVGLLYNVSKFVKNSKILACLPTENNFHLSLE